MQVSKWGDSLAIRLPSAIVEMMGLKEGDDIEIFVAGARAFEVSKAPSARDPRPATQVARQAPGGLQVRAADGK